MKKIIVLFMVVIVGYSAFSDVNNMNNSKDQLVIIWTSGDPEVAHRVCLMYTHAAKINNWFKDVTLIVWGPSARLLSGDKELQTKISNMQKDGVVIQACIVCSDSYGVTENLRAMGIEVKAMGKPLTEYLKSDFRVLSF